MKVFDNYSRYYDLFYSSKNYKAESEYVHQLIQQYAPTTKDVLDLGCGTGKHDFHLADLGYNIEGFDLSAKMINQARINSRQQSDSIAAKVSFEVGDIRTLNRGKKYDTIVSLFHVMSYQTTNEDLRSVFKTIESHLKPNGIFIFDFWYGPAVLTDLPETRVKKLRNEDITVTRIAEPEIFPNENCVNVNYTIFVKDNQTNFVDEITETHKMRYLFTPELRTFTQLSMINSFTWMDNKALGFNSWNGVMILKKV